MKITKPLFIFDLITLMPEMFKALTSFGVTGRAFNSGLVELNLCNPRNFTKDIHKTVDDKSYGGGPGMLMMVEPLVEAIHSIKDLQSKKELKKAKVIHMSPKGVPLNERLVKKLLKEESLIILASRYEGVDERISQWIDEEISIGDYVLSGGELPAMVLMDTLIRHIPGALNDEESANQDSFVDGLLDCPHYTRPDQIGGVEVPAVLMSGNHEEIRKWRLKQALGRTHERRPDLLEKLNLSREQELLLAEFLKDVNR
jgi:tRNA (guanine37-N1)-methyltransferase